MEMDQWTPVIFKTYEDFIKIASCFPRQSTRDRMMAPNSTAFRAGSGSRRTGDSQSGIHNRMTPSSFCAGHPNPILHVTALVKQNNTHSGRRILVAGNLKIYTFR